MAYLDQSGKLVGIAVDIVREIQRRTGNTDIIRMVPWARGLTEIDTKKNTLLFTMARTAERNRKYQWIGPVDEALYAFFVKADSPIAINTLDDAKKIAAIGVYKGDIREKYLRDNGFDNLQTVTDNTLNFKKLMAGRIDMYASTLDTIQSEAEAAGYDIADVKTVFIFLRSQAYIAASNGTDSSIVASWNTALRKIKEDGTMKAIFEKYAPGKKLPGQASAEFDR